MFSCPVCKALFTRKFTRDRHVGTTHNNIKPIYTCSLCGGVFKGVKNLQDHRRQHTAITRFIPIISAMKKNCIIYRKSYEKKMDSLELAFHSDKPDITELLKSELSLKQTLKATLVYHIEFMKDNDGAERLYEMCFRRAATELQNLHDIPSFIAGSNEECQTRVLDFIENGSGWIFQEIISTDVEIGGCRPLNGACNRLSIKYFKTLLKTKRSPNMQQCFMQAVAYHFKKSDNLKVLQKFIDCKLKVSISNPVRVKDIPKFERANKDLDFKINVIYREGCKYFPIYTSKEMEKKHHINLLLYQTWVNGEVVNHYTYIEDLNILLRTEYNTTKKSYEKCAVCPNCLSKFSSQSVLNSHMSACYKNKPQRVVVPQAGEVLKFEHFNNKFECPINGFFDFEAIQQTPDAPCTKCERERVKTIKACTHLPPTYGACFECGKKASQNSYKCRHKTVISTYQNPAGYSLLIMDKNRKVLHLKQYTGDDCVDHFTSTILDIEKDLLKRLNTYVPMDMTDDNCISFNQAVICHICSKDLNGDKVRDHCHLSGTYLGAAHNSCNLNRKESKKIPLQCHNFAG